MKTIYIVRHGQSAANAGLPTSDPALIPQTELGWQQARTIAGLLDVEPSAVITSNYERAKDTAIPFCERWKATPTQEPLLHEFVTLSPAVVGGMDLKARAPLVDAYWQAADPHRRHGLDSESFHDLASRVRGFRSLLDGLAHDTVIFGHGMWFALLIWQLQHFGCDDSESMSAFRKYQLALPMPNCAVYRLLSTGNDGTWAVHFDNALHQRLHGSSREVETRAATMAGA